MNNTTFWRFFASFCFTIALSSCGFEETASNDTNAEAVSEKKQATALTIKDQGKSEESKTMELSGKVVFKPMEGGFYAIDGDDGKKYLPLNLPDHAKKGGIKVAMQVIVVSGVVTIYNYGIPIEIQSLEITDATAEGGNVM